MAPRGGAPNTLLLVACAIATYRSDQQVRCCTGLSRTQPFLLRGEMVRASASLGVACAEHDHALSLVEACTCGSCILSAPSCLPLQLSNKPLGGGRDASTYLKMFGGATVRVIGEHDDSTLPRSSKFTLRPSASISVFVS